MKRNAYNAKIQQSFEYVRRILFPKWDRRRLWTVQPVSELSDDQGAICDKRARRIRVLLNGNLDLHVLFVHEICHAVSRSCHGPVWQEAMRQASLRARQSGLNDLSDKIDAHVTSLFPTIDEVMVVYSDIEEWAKLGLPYLAFIHFFCSERKINRTQFNEDYPEAKERYQKAIEQAAGTDAEP